MSEKIHYSDGKALSKKNEIAGYCGHGRLLENIKKALEKTGKTPATVTIEDLAAIDEFHIGGCVATDHLANKMNLSCGQTLLDIGCGLGGPARHLVSKFGVKVAGIDLTQEYIDTAITINEWLGLDEDITLIQGNALFLPFDDNSFDCALMLHVGMNIKDKRKLFDEIYRVIMPGGLFALYDVMKLGKNELDYPVPWAESGETSFLESPEKYMEILMRAGFEHESTELRGEFAKASLKQQTEILESSDGIPPMGIHIVIGDQAPIKLSNLATSVFDGKVTPIEIVAKKTII